MNMGNLGKLVMIPVPIGAPLDCSVPTHNAQYCTNIRHFFVENVREARRFLKSVDKGVDIDQLSFSEINQNAVVDLKQLSTWLKSGVDVGVISDAGCPGIADPGALLAAHAQELGARVVPLVGPSSIILSLMASGMNGQSFAFNGYLPVKEPQRSQQIKRFESIVIQTSQTQIFIETPYRNNQLLNDLLKYCQKKTKLCVALGISTEQEDVRTLTIEQWTRLNVVLPKAPAVFMIGQ